METEQMCVASPPGETGMLVVDSIVPGGPCETHLEPGDVLVGIEGNAITHFLQLETLLDEKVDQNIQLLIERGGRTFVFYAKVQDLHSVTPDYFLEVSGGVIHPLSYQQARNFGFHCGLVYVAEPGYMLFRAAVPRYAIIKKLDGKEISRLEDLISVLSKLARGAIVPLDYVSHKDHYQNRSVFVMIDRHEWYAQPQIYKCDDSTGLWIAKPAFPAESPLLVSGRSNVVQARITWPHSDEASLMGHMHLHMHHGSVATCTETSLEYIPKGQNARYSDGGTEKMRQSDGGKKRGRGEEDLSPDSVFIAKDFMRDDQATLVTNSSVAERAIEPTLVMLEVHVPSSCMVDGLESQYFFGTGVVIYHNHGMGLVAVGKNTVAASSSDVMLCFAASRMMKIPGEVVFLHPEHYYALVAYNPLALGAGASEVKAAQLLPETHLRSGDHVHLVRLSSDLKAISSKSIVTVPYGSLDISSADGPCYRAMNMEFIELQTGFHSTFSGVLTDEHGKVQAIWASFSTQVVRGIPIYAISRVLDKILCGADAPNFLSNGVRRLMPFFRILEVDLHPTPLCMARNYGLTKGWAHVFIKKDPVRCRVLTVNGSLAGLKDENSLHNWDMLLAINKNPVACFQDVESACHALVECNTSDGKLNMAVFRQGRAMNLQVGTDLRDGNGITHIINWCGCVVHDHVRNLGVFLSRLCPGSPADRYGLCALRWIVEIDGQPTPNLNAFREVTKKLEDFKPFSVKMVDVKGIRPQIVYLKQNLHYWPTSELIFDSDAATWQRKTIKAVDTCIA